MAKSLDRFRGIHYVGCDRANSTGGWRFQQMSVAWRPVRPSRRCEKYGRPARRCTPAAVDSADAQPPQAAARQAGKSAMKRPRAFGRMDSSAAPSAASNAARTSAPISKCCGPMHGRATPSARPGSAQGPHGRSMTPAARPAAGMRGCHPVAIFGGQQHRQQSAVRMAHTRPACRVTAASADRPPPGRGP